MIIKVDSGPGRTNLEMLVYMRTVGVYCYPGVPNTTHVSQETDQNYGIFKSVFRENLEILSQARFDQRETLQITDLPLLVFGGRDTSTNVDIRDSFSSAFSVDANISCWKKCGAVPLTRSSLLSNQVRHEVVVEDNGTIDLESDPQVLLLANLELQNKTHCAILDSKGFDGSQFRLDAPRVLKTNTQVLTRPQTQERIEAIAKAKGAGQLFHVTGGEHISSNDFFKSRALTEKKEQVEKMEQEKSQFEASKQIENDKVSLIQRKGEITEANKQSFLVAEIKILLKWKQCKNLIGNKNALLQRYFETPNPQEISQWNEVKEQELVRLRDNGIVMKDTALAVSTKQMANAVCNNVNLLSTPEKTRLIETLNEEEEEVTMKVEEI